MRCAEVLPLYFYITYSYIKNHGLYTFRDEVFHLILDAPLFNLARDCPNGSSPEFDAIHIEVSNLCAQIKNLIGSTILLQIFRSQVRSVSLFRHERINFGREGRDWTYGQSFIRTPLLPLSYFPISLFPKPSRTERKIKENLISSFNRFTSVFFLVTFISLLS